jgi:pentapeptide MXKDX repeat protein
MKLKLHWSMRSVCAALLIAGIPAVADVHADEAASRPVATKHQMMKECMAKQKASDAGMSKEQMKKNCREVTQTEHENAKTDKESADQAAGTPRT